MLVINHRLIVALIYFQWFDNWAVREGQWKLISGKTLHNLGDEKPERKNYATEKPRIVKALRARYDAWAKDVFSGK